MACHFMDFISSLSHIPRIALELLVHSLFESYSADIIRGTGAPGELQRKMKGSINIDTTACLGKFDTLDIHPEAKGIVESIVERFSTLSRKSNRQLINMDLRIVILENKCW